MDSSENNLDHERQQLVELFSSYKAEWLKERLFDLFTKPAYFPQLLTSYPCFLIGGRGTGKTTTLKCLSYEGQFILEDKKTKKMKNWPFYGLYLRVNTNRVTAFRGPELSEAKWIKLFAHYFNLHLCILIFDFLSWYYKLFPNAQQLSNNDLSRISTSLNLKKLNNIIELSEALKLSLDDFESYINNVGDGLNLPKLSMQGAPVDVISEAIQKLPHFKDKYFFFLIDEYENFEDYQQRVVNTLIKHSGANYTFKIGVRELGFRQRSTLNPNEQLIDPADYIRVDIVEILSPKFNDFASSVCNGRMKKATPNKANEISDIRVLFPEMDAEREAELLGLQGHLWKIDNEAQTQISGELLKWFKGLKPLEKYVLDIWGVSQNDSFQSTIKEAMDNPYKWRKRYENYKHAFLFTIRRGKRGIRKYYNGWNVFCLLAAGNIRYLLQLVDTSLINHLDKGFDLAEPIDAKTQTEAVQQTGRKNLRELEGISIYGARLTKLLLALGRIFQVMSENTEGTEI